MVWWSLLQLFLNCTAWLCLGSAYLCFAKKFFHLCIPFTESNLQFCPFFFWMRRGGKQCRNEAKIRRSHQHYSKSDFDIGFGSNPLHSRSASRCLRGTISGSEDLSSEVYKRFCDTCCCLPLLPCLDCRSHATWSSPFCRALCIILQGVRKFPPQLCQALASSYVVTMKYPYNHVILTSREFFDIWNTYVP